MKLEFGDDVEAFRAEFRDWLERNRPTAEEMAADPALSTAHVPGWAREWTGRMFRDGWLVPGWPPERGGRSAGPVETLVYLETLIEEGVPRTTNPQGLGIVVPSILDYGSPEQIERWAMPVLRGERSACLGMSEPDAGSDLAALSTRAILDGDHFVVNGQKVWTSGANYADFCFLFCRTDPDAPKHKGISILLVDMDTPGITVRPLPEIVHPEHPDLNEVFFADVVVPADQLVGELNHGWAMANGSLAHERGMVWLDGVLRLEAAMRDALDDARRLLPRLRGSERGAATDRVVDSYVDTVAARCLGYRGFAKLVRGGSAPEQALMKAFCTESEQRLASVLAELHADGGLDRTPAGEGGAMMSFDGTWTERYFRSFGGTISAGTSEIQRNIIAERVLGLPR
ncbi:MAG: acyl-CoA dehydrogenase family protein [Acidimicrobiales bacterium]|nr:acyl-CoA dehydrogenase family protein [Acidimicrobiales bacterium]